MKKIFITFVIFLVCACGASAEIIPTPHLKLIESTIKKADSDTLVIFDVDDVLITAKDQILQSRHRKFLDILNKDLEDHYSEEDAKKLWSIIMLTRSDDFVDPKIVSLIKEAQSRGIKVIALTNAWTGPFGDIPSLEDWRVAELEDFGYTFRDSWSDIKSKTFEKLKSKDPKWFPVFKHGVLFTCEVPKGDVLKAFLQYVGFTPKVIIFIDDKEKHLKSVETFCQKAGIKFIGFQYTAVAARPKTPLDEKRARLQFEILEKEHRWLNDQKADLRAQLMKKPLSKVDEIKKMNQQKFAALKKYNLPLGEYAITGSGPLGIRNLRKIDDIDIVVSSELKDVLIAKYGVTDDGKVKKVVFPEGNIEAFWEGSFYGQQKDVRAPTVVSIISRAEIIEGLPFASLEDVLYFKCKTKRDKDLEDIRLIEKWQKTQNKNLHLS